MLASLVFPFVEKWQHSFCNHNTKRHGVVQTDPPLQFKSQGAAVRLQRRGKKAKKKKAQVIAVATKIAFAKANGESQWGFVCLSLQLSS